jgi:hypothetical protein
VSGAWFIQDFKHSQSDLSARGVKGLSLTPPAGKS